MQKVFKESCRIRDSAYRYLTHAFTIYVRRMLQNEAADYHGVPSVQITGASSCKRAAVADWVPYDIYRVYTAFISLPFTNI